MAEKEGASGQELSHKGKQALGDNPCCLVRLPYSLTTAVRQVTRGEQSRFHDRSGFCCPCAETRASAAKVGSSCFRRGVVKVSSKVSSRLT